jgi:hypothetical protein
VACPTLNRAGTALLMTSFAVAVKGIPSRHIRIRTVTPFTAAGHGTFLLFVMAIIASKSVPVITCMGLMIKQYLACGGLEYEPDGFFRGFLRKGRVTNDAHHEQDGRQGKCQ